MSQLFGYLCSDDSLAHAVMADVGDQFLSGASDLPVGLGLGWIQEGRTLLRKHPQPRATTTDVSALLSDVPSRAIVGHIDRRAPGSVSADNMQPFRFRNWVYAQHGQFEDMDGLWESLKTEIPDHIRRNIQGTSIDEIIFHVFLTRLQDKGVLNEGSSRDTAEILAETMRFVESKARDLGHETVTPFLAIAASERLLVAARMGDEPMYYRYFEGIDEALEKPLFAGHRPTPVQHPRFRAVLLATEVMESARGQWEELPSDHRLWVESKWKVQTAPFGPVGP